MIALAKCQLGGVLDNGMYGQAMDIAKWSVKGVSLFTGIQGQQDITVMTVRNVRTQVVSGIKYFMDVDYLVAGENNKYYFKSCNVEIWDQPWTNTRRFTKDPVCGANPAYPNKRDVLAGGWTDSTVDALGDIPRWALSSLSQYSGVQGQQQLTQLSIRNVKSQVVSGMNYSFDIDLLVAGPENKYYFKSCNVKVYDQSWTQTRQFIGTPVCGAHPNYPNF
jgi:hypothetical protein